MRMFSDRLAQFDWEYLLCCGSSAIRKASWNFQFFLSLFRSYLKPRMARNLGGNTLNIHLEPVLPILALRSLRPVLWLPGNGYLRINNRVWGLLVNLVLFPLSMRWFVIVPPLLKWWNERIGWPQRKTKKWKRARWTPNGCFFGVTSITNPSLTRQTGQSAT